MAEGHIALENLTTSSETMRRFLASFVEGAIGVMDNYDEELEVVESDTPAMSVVVEAGAALVGAGVENAFYTNTSDNTLTISSNSSGSARVDRIVVELDLSQSAGSDTCQVKVVEGTPGAGAPSLTQTASVYQMSLAQVAVMDSETEITDAEITDERSFVLSQADHQTYIEKASDESVTSSTTLQNDDDFTFTAEANATYKVQILIYLVTATAPDWKFQFSVPGSGTVDGNVAGSNTSSAVETVTEASANSFLISSGTDAVVLITVTIQDDGTGGTVNFQWAQSTSDGTATTVKAGSWMEYKKVA